MELEERKQKLLCLLEESSRRHRAHYKSINDGSVFDLIHPPRVHESPDFYWTEHAHSAPTRPL